MNNTSQNAPGLIAPDDDLERQNAKLRRITDVLMARIERNTEQTGDAFSLTNTTFKNVTLFYGYIGQVRRIFGQTVSAGSSNVDTHLLNAKFKLGENWSLTPYAYLIDDKDVTAFSTSTFGARSA